MPVLMAGPTPAGVGRLNPFFIRSKFGTRLFSAISVGELLSLLVSIPSSSGLSLELDFAKERELLAEEVRSQSLLHQV